MTFGWTGMASKSRIEKWGKWESEIFSPMGQSSILSGAGKFCLVHGLRQLTRDVKMTSIILNFRSDFTYALPRNVRDVTNVINKRNDE